MTIKLAHQKLQLLIILFFPTTLCCGGREREPEVQGNEDAVSLLTMQTCPNRMLAQWRLGIIEKNALYGTIMRLLIYPHSHRTPTFHLVEVWEQCNKQKI